MDRPTLDLYNNSASGYARRWEEAESPVASLLPHVFPGGSRILEIGFGSGRDLTFLHRLGMDVWGADPVEKLVKEAASLHPELKGRLFTGGLPDSLPGNLPKPFDGIILSAVLMHIPDEDLFQSACTLRDCLKEGGKLVVSFPTERDDIEPGESRDTTGRLMILRPASRVKLLFERLGFEITGTWESADSLGRAGIRWCTLVMVLRGSVSASVDRIESIINRDRKTASYKLALLKALCDIAQLEAETVSWDGEGRVRVPIDAITRKWIEYYWPVVSSPVFIPQTRGEHVGYKKPIAFRKDLTALARRYAEDGGLSQFIFDRNRNKIIEGASTIYSAARRKVRTAIINGPVFYAGCGTSESKPFSYNRESRAVVFSSDIWRELVLLGHWIGDSISLRWAELTRELSHNTLELHSILPLFVTVPVPDRNVTSARQVFTTRESRECVWTGKTMKGGFDVDHAIPFSLRHDNSLWNLFPALPWVNNAKRDKLPSGCLLKKSTDRMISYWALLREDLPDIFISDFRRFTGLKKMPRNGWQTILLRTFAEAVETTASLRGVERWEP